MYSKLKCHELYNHVHKINVTITYSIPFCIFVSWYKVVVATFRTMLTTSSSKKDAKICFLSVWVKKICLSETSILADDASCLCWT